MDLWMFFLCALLKIASTEITEIKCMKVDIVEYLGLLDVKCYNISESSTSSTSPKTTLTWNVTERITNVNTESTTTNEGVQDLTTSTYPDLTSKDSTSVGVSTGSEASTVGPTLVSSTRNSSDLATTVTSVVIPDDSTAKTNISVDETTKSFISTTLNTATTNAVFESDGVTVDHQNKSSTLITDNALTSEVIALTSTEASKTTDVTSSDNTTMPVIDILGTLSTTPLPIISSSNIIDSTSSSISESPGHQTDLNTDAVQVFTNFTEFTKITIDGQIICDVTIGLNFKCKSYGRFLDESIQNCQGYIFCVAMRNGSFASYRYKCPVGTKFNNNTKMCTDNKYYDCPCTTSETLTSITTPSINSFTTEIKTPIETRTYEFSKETFSVTYSSDFITTKSTSSGENSLTIETDKSSVSTISTEDHSISPEQFPPSTESATGLGSTTDGYYQNTTSASTIFTENSVIIVSEVDSQLVNTEIPLNTDVTAVTNISDTTTVTGSPNNIIDETTTTERSTEPTLIVPSTGTTTTETQTNNKCNKLNGLNFVCSDFGRFLDESVPACKGYIYCVPMRNGSYALSRYECPVGTSFNNNSKMCAVSNECQCQLQQSQPSTTINNTSRTDEIPNEDITTTTIQIINTTLRFYSTVLNNISSTVLEPIHGSSSTPSTMNIDATASFTDIFENNSITEGTTREGNYFTENTVSHSTTDSIDIVSSTKPSPSFFPNEVSSLSSISVTYTTSEPTNFTSGVSVSSQETDNSSSSSATFNINSAQSVTNELGDVGSTVGIQDGSNSFTKDIADDSTSMQVTNGSNIYEVTTSTDFSNTQELLDSTVNTANSFVTDMSLGDKILCDVENGLSFQCSSRGRFLDETVEDCGGYIYCVQLEDATFILTRYKCPSGFYFNKGTLLCTANYVCPCITKVSNSDGITNLSEGTTSFGNKTVTSAVPTMSTPLPDSRTESIPEASTTLVTDTTFSKGDNLSVFTTNNGFTTSIISNLESGSISNQGSTSTETPSTETNGSITTEVNQNYTETTIYVSTIIPSTANVACGRPTIEECITTGRFADYTNHDCKNYIYCVNVNGIMENRLYTCPYIYIFNPNTNLCSDPSSYICPC